MIPFMYSKVDIEQMVTTMSPEETKKKVQWDGYTTWQNNNYRGTIEVATGVGKTKIALIAANAEFMSNPDALVYIAVPTETLRDVDWPNEMRKWGFEYLLNKVKIICHASLQSEVPERDVDLFIWDECHHLTEQNSIFIDRNKVYRIMFLTATLPTMKGTPDEAAKRLMIDSYAPCVFKITLDQAIALKLVSDYEITVLYFKLDSLRLNINQGTEEKKNMTTEAAYYMYLTAKIKKCLFGKNPKAKFFWIGKRSSLIYNANSKLALAREVMNNLITPTNRTLIFCGSIDQSKKLCGENVYNSSTNDSALTKFQNQEINYLGAVDALNEGKNIDLIDNVIMIQVSSKERDAVQRTGRSIRWREGHVGKLVVLVAKGTSDEKWFDNAFKNFDKNKIKKYEVKVNYDQFSGSIQVPGG